MILWFDAPGLGKVRVVPSDTQFCVEVDNGPLFTPKGKNVLLPSQKLAENVCHEIISIGQKHKGARLPDNAMLYLQLVITAIDLIQGAEARVAKDLFELLPLDMLLFRSPSEDLFLLQQEKWDEVVNWARRQFGLNLGISTTFQLPEVGKHGKLSKYLEAQDYYKLMGLSHLTALSGSLILTLALQKAFTTANDAFDITMVEDSYQAANWGKDALETERQNQLRREFVQTTAYLQSLNE